MKDIAEIIPTGYENRVSRTHLVIFTGHSDRKVRRLIEESEYPIINVDDGYFIPDYSNERDRNFARYYYARETKRARSVLRKLNKYRGLMNQMELEQELNV